LRDIFSRQYSSVDDITGRAAALGLLVPPGGRGVGICLAVEPAPTGPPNGPAGTSFRSADAPVAAGSPSAAGGASVAHRRHGSQAASPVGGPRERARRDFSGHRPPAGPSAVSDAVATAAERVFGVALSDEIDGSHLIVGALAGDDLRGLVEAVADALDAELDGGKAVAVTCGPTVDSVGALARSLRVAREASVLARRLRSGMRTLLATDLGVHRLLGRFASDPELATFVEEQLGSLLDYDAAHRRELVHTLDTLLSVGLSKAAAARALGIRRQTLYQRLEKISTLLGGLDLDSRERRTAIDLALVGWRLRAAAVSGTPQP
jgi:purine catabolism regulator